MNGCSFKGCLLALGFLVVPTTAWANAGTPLMWAGMLHLAFGNLLIGVAEGWMLARWFGASRTRATAAMVAANYLSAWLGLFILQSSPATSLPVDLNNGWHWYWAMVAGTYCVTLLIEFPFILWILKSSQRLLSKAVKASLAVQATSYLALFGWYWMAGHMSLYTSGHIVDPRALNLPKDVVIWFINPDDGAVHRRTLGQPAATKVFDLASTNRNDRILVQPSASGVGRWDVAARLETGSSRNPAFVSIATNLDLMVAADPSQDGASASPAPNTWFNFGRVPVLGGATNGHWSYSTDFWAAGGLRVRNDASKSSARFAFETPFASWYFRNAVQLPNDQVIFQLGHDQICAFDPTTRSFAFLFRGRGPTVVIEKPPVP